MEVHHGHVKIIRMGHAAVLIEASGTRLLIDPGNVSAPEAFDLEGLDGIVVTHQHPDHLDPDRIGALLDRNDGATLLCDPETADVVEHGEWTAHTHDDETFIGGLTVLGVGARHAEILPSLPRIANTGVLVSAEGQPTLFHPGDSYELPLTESTCSHSPSTPPGPRSARRSTSSPGSPPPRCSPSTMPRSASVRTASTGATSRTTAASTTLDRLGQTESTEVG